MGIGFKNGSDEAPNGDLPWYQQPDVDPAMLKEAERRALRSGRSLHQEYIELRYGTPGMPPGGLFG